MNMRFSKGELTPEQEELIQQAGQASGIAVSMSEAGDLTIQNLSSTEFYSLAYTIQERWGLSFRSVHVTEVEE